MPRSPLASRTFTDLIRGAAWLALATVLGQLLGLIALAVVARRIAPAGVGSYTFCVALTAYFVLPVNFGIGNIALRDVSSGSVPLETVAREMMTAQLALSVVMYGILIALTPLLASNSLAQHLLPIVGLTLFTNAISFEWALQAAGRLRLNGLWRLAGQLTYFILAVALVAHSTRHGATQFATFTIVGYAVVAIGTFGSAVRAMGGFPGLAPPRAAWRRVRRSASTGYALAMVQIYYSIDSVMLGYIKDSAVVGIYGVAYRLPLAFITIGGVWSSAIVPHAAALFRIEPARLRRDLGRAIAAAIVIGIGAITVSTACAGGLMPALFGSRYSAAATPFWILMIAGSIVLLSTNLAPIVTALGNRRAFAVATTLGAVVNVAVNFALIPSIGARGAAIATVAAELVVAGYTGLALRRMLGPIELELHRLARALPAAAAALGGYFALRGALGALGTTIAVTAIFILAAFATGALDRALVRPATDAPSA